MSGYYRVKHIDENIYRINSDEGVNSDLFVGTDRALLLDTGYGFGTLRDTIREITEKPLTIVNSHGHMDHAGGNWQFNEKFFIHPLDESVLKKHLGKAMREMTVSEARQHIDWAYEGARDILPDTFNEEEYITASIPEHQHLDEGDVFKLGGITLEAIHLPGHTPGSTALLYKEKNWIFLADAMNPFVFLFLEEAAPLAEYINSVKKVIGLNTEKQFIAHQDAPLAQGDLERFLECAEHLDYADGEEFHHPLAEGREVLVCCRQGYSFSDIGKGKPGFAAIVISPDKL